MNNNKYNIYCKMSWTSEVGITSLTLLKLCRKGDCLVMYVEQLEIINKITDEAVNIPIRTNSYKIANPRGRQSSSELTKKLYRQNGFNPKDPEVKESIDHVASHLGAYEADKLYNNAFVNHISFAHVKKSIHLQNQWSMQKESKQSRLYRYKAVRGKYHGKQGLYYAKYAALEPNTLVHFKEQTTSNGLRIPIIGLSQTGAAMPALFFQSEQKEISIISCLTPYMINTMEKDIVRAHGNVLCLGLNLGYFAYMVSLKEDVTSVTIVEKNKYKLNWFRRYIMPQMETRWKIKTVLTEPVEFSNEIDKRYYDYAFVNCYNDPYDNYALADYIIINELQKRKTHPATFFFWGVKDIMAKYNAYANACKIDQYDVEKTGLRSELKKWIKPRVDEPAGWSMQFIFNEVIDEEARPKRPDIRTKVDPLKNAKLRARLVK